MGSYELAVVNTNNQLMVIEDKYSNEIPCIEYYLVDKSKYSFEYKINDEIDVNMFESDRTYDSNDFIDADFEEIVDELDYSYYKISVASGILTGALSCVNSFPKGLDQVKQYKPKDWDNVIIIIAKKIGYDKSDLKGAISYIKDRIIPYVDDEFQKEASQGLDNILENLSCHPSIAGLVFSILTQFSGDKYSLGDKVINMTEVPEYYAIGRNNVEKIVYALLYWIFNLSVDCAISNKKILEEMKIPKEMVYMLKDLFKLPIFERVPKNYIEAEKIFSKWIQKIFENSTYENNDGEAVVFDLGSEINKVNQTMFQNIPLMINEAIVRSFYLIKKLTGEIKTKDIRTAGDLNKIDVQKILPFNNRLVSRMTLIASGCFVGINVAGSVIKAVTESKVNGRDFKKVLLTEINFAGVGRFVFACINDQAYWKEDLTIFLQRKERRKTKQTVEDEKIYEDMFEGGTFKALSLDAAQARALYSLENILVLKDIEKTIKADEKHTKQEWHKDWMDQLLEQAQVNSEEFFVLDEDEIYEAFKSLKNDNETKRWFYLLTMELALFEPYYPLKVESDKQYKKLHMSKYDYIKDQFVRRQTIVSQSEVDSILDSYKRYKSLVSGSAQGKIIAFGAAIIVAAGTGGLAMAFAPGIATMLAGEAVVGLHGAALTNAALAYVGGGSLAAGGLGMAGGTAIITGGGAILGLAGTGTTSMAIMFTQTSSGFWIRQITKLLVFCKCVLKDRLNDTNSIKQISCEMKHTIRKIEDNIRELEAEKCTLDDEVIKKSKECLKYLSRCNTELEKLIK